jgi:hypothetical protein
VSSALSSLFPLEKPSLSKKLDHRGFQTFVKNERRFFKRKKRRESWHQPSFRPLKEEILNSTSLSTQEPPVVKVPELALVPVSIMVA